VSGADLRLGFSPSYLLQTLEAIPSGRVQAGLVDGKKVGMFYPLDHPRMTLVAMPKLVKE
jgi:DNA polymerase III sliding clamp (beta) subunit (PCNA family)